MKWIIDEGVLKGVDGEEIIFPNAKQIFLANDTITVNGCMYPFCVEGIKFSKMIALNISIEFYSDKNSIYSRVCAVKNGNKYLLSFVNSMLLDYVIIDNRWHYLDPKIKNISEIFKKNHISDQKINLYEYFNVKKELVQSDLDFEDNVSEYMFSVKNGENYIATPIGLNGELYSYQKAGFNWLVYMCNLKCGCILGDEMGLGKTLQVLSVISYLINQNDKQHFLIVCPVSLLVNWKNEMEKFYPNIKGIIHYGDKRTGFYKNLLDYNVVITSYGCVQTDFSMFQMIDWRLMICDEAQNVKNPNAKRTKLIKQISCEQVIAVTGTPFENHVSDVWSITDLVIPSYLGNLSFFQRNYADNLESAYDIEKMLTPIMIRRKVSEVADDLPERIDISQSILMTEKEAGLYERERITKNKRDELNNFSIDKIQKLRMFCTHPFVYETMDTNDPAAVSNKYMRTMEIVEEILLKNEKALIFTSFNKMIEIFKNDIEQRFGVKVFYINGTIAAKERQKIVDEFSSLEKGSVLVLNPKAAGTGLNITCANHVIHYNLEWNPAVEDQASARAYRNGQKKPVIVYRLYYNNTIEEVINEKIEQKRAISDVAIIGNDGKTEHDYLIKALSLSPIMKGE